MARAYHSTVLERPAADVWAAIRDFGAYAWAGTVSEAQMEDGRAGDSVGAVRSVVSPAGRMRQRLLAHSDLDRSYTYTICDPCPFPVRNYLATLRVTPVVDGGRAFAEWWATFDCAGDDVDRWVRHFESGFAAWLRALGRHLGA